MARHIREYGRDYSATDRGRRSSSLHKLPVVIRHADRCRDTASFSGKYPRFLNQAAEAYILGIYTVINNAAPADFSAHESDCVHAALKSNYRCVLENTGQCGA